MMTARTARRVAFGLIVLIVVGASAVIGGMVMAGCKAGEVKERLATARPAAERAVAYLGDVRDVLDAVAAGAPLDNPTVVGMLEKLTPADRALVEAAAAKLLKGENVTEAAGTLKALAIRVEGAAVTAMSHLNTLQEQLKDAKDDDDATLAVVATIVSAIFGTGGMLLGRRTGAVAGATVVSESINAAREEDARLDEAFNALAGEAKAAAHRVLAKKPVVKAAVLEKS